LGDHTETVQIDFDPERIAYEDLLAVFWASHDPRRAPWSIQYKNVVFVHDDEQRRAAERTRDHMARVNGYLDGYGTLDAAVASFRVRPRRQASSGPAWTMTLALW